MATMVKEILAEFDLQKQFSGKENYPPPQPSYDVWATDQYRSRHSKYEESSRPKHPG